MKYRNNPILAFFLLIALFSCDTTSQFNSQENKVPKTTFNSTSFTIDKKLDEISGLQLVDDSFYGFNDSGGEPELYKINNDGRIVQTIRLLDAKNIDWESMAMNDSHIFIADAGNNRGNRKDLCIYYIDRDDIEPNKVTQEVKAKKISFYYPEQTNFEKQSHKHDFDCEAICYFNGKLHLFTKEWKSNQTHHYTLEVTEQPQPAKLISSYDTKFLVTGADILKINDETSLLALIGYTKIGTIHLIQTTVSNNQDELLTFPKQTTHLGRSGRLGQVEGVAIESPKVIFYSAEAYKNVPQHITKLEAIH
ncbi:hypothetical protein C7377_1154 [Balneicella halophila]|uniref:SdiA-regulated protein n=1 Tax=Balneicella halophila TaxID=1537566 RepID=A0A7L4UPV1_BALHA|nr:hypothetical protein [Balneicella halophila]PVX50836.1 hypothetical protein C7377_1154 [Balneicella halophila]